MNSPWRIQMLGRLSAQKDDLVVTRFATSRAAALLARLALFPKRAHSREELADLLWPEADTDAGRLNLRVALASLRRQLEPPGSPPGSVLIADRSLIRLNSQACRSDAAEFELALSEAARASELSKKREALDHALALYAGELMPGFYDEWILDERERLQALFEEAGEQYQRLPQPKRPLPSEIVTEIASESVSRLPRASSARPPAGFPIQFTRFFGRESEKARLAEMLCDPDISLVTLIGPGGAGKTRLALETARQVADCFSGLVCFVPLADIGDSTQISTSIATALRLPLSGEATPRVQVAAHLAEADSLLVLDNLEHLGAAGAMETQALLVLTPGLTCLVTSRQRLDLAGEREFLLPPLPIPDPGEAPAALTQHSSVQLFVDRAQAVRPDFQVTPGNAEAVTALCRSLEGLPLALELAAARIQTLTPGQMQEQLKARLDFLTSRRRDLPPRHRSLRAALEWSVQFLTPDQRHFFVQLSVFRGGWTWDSASAVCETDDALELLEQLRERSLLVTEEPSSPELAMRFRILESMREYGEEQLSLPERLALSRRHAEYFSQFAAQMDALWDSPEQIRAMAALDADYDNLRAALTFCRQDPLTTEWNSGEAGLCLAGSLGNYWTIRGLLQEGRDWLAGALSQAGSEAAQIKALIQAGWLAAGMGDYSPANTLLTEAIALSRRLGDLSGESMALRIRGTAALWHGDYPSAAPDLEEALAVGRRSGSSFLLASALNSMGVLTYQGRGDKVQARNLYEEALPLFLECGAQQRASFTLHNLGCIAHDFKDYDRADALLRHSLTLADTLGDLWHRAYCLRSLGDVRRERDDLLSAALLFEEGIALSHRLGDRTTEAGTLLSLAVTRRRQEDWAAATAAAQAALRLYQALGYADGRAESWLNLAETAAAQEQWERTAWFLSASSACQATPPVGDGAGAEYLRIDSLRQNALTALGPDAFAAAWEHGQTLTCDEYGFRTE